MGRVSLGIPAVLVTVILLACVLARAQNQDYSKGSTEASPKSKSEKKINLLEATRVSTTDAAKSAAKDESAESGTSKTSADSGDAAVLEFKPTASAEERPVAVHSDASKKSMLKNAHGNVYGAAGAGNRETGGAVGTASKGGKTSVYVEANRSRTNPPR